MRRLAVLLAVLVGLPALLTLAPVTAASALPTDEVHPEWGSTASADATIKRGCRGYAYTYALTPPAGDWSLETFLVGPRGRAYGSGFFLTGDDPLVGSSQFKLCKRTTQGGRYTIRALLTVQNGEAGASYAGWLPDTTFRLKKPR